MGVDTTQSEEEAPSSTRTSTYTSTAPGGEPVTITAIEIVPGKKATPTPAPEHSGDGDLQHGNPAPRHGARVFQAVAGALVGGALLL